MRFNRFLSTALLAVAAIAQVRGQTAQLHFVSTRWPPFTNPPGASRFAIDLVNEALKRIGLSAETAIVDEAMFTTALLSGKFDGSAAAWKDAEREAVLLYSEPYLENRLMLVGRRGADVTAKSLSDLAGKRIVLVGGYSYGDQVNRTAGPVFIHSSGEEDSLATLLAGNADYTLMDELVIQYILNNHGDQARSRLEIGSTPLITRTLHLAVRRSRPGVEGLVTRFNAEIKRMIVDRTFHQLLQLDWILADVDGDGRAEVVSRTDQAGPRPPERPYDLALSAPKTHSDSDAQRFYFGGSIYETWAAVPQNYKTSNSDRPDPARSTASVFRFTW
jgi:polar amino acid transport system substrate-binding protein